MSRNTIFSQPFKNINKSILSSWAVQKQLALGLEFADLQLRGLLTVVSPVLELFMAHSRCSTNICPMTEPMNQCHLILTDQTPREWLHLLVITE